MAKQVWLPEDANAMQEDANTYDDGGLYGMRKRKRKIIEEGQYTDLGF